MTEISPLKDMNIDKRVFISPMGWMDDEGKRYCNIFAIGPLTRDAEEKCYKKAKVSFCIKYGKDGFLNCDVWEDSPFFQMARCLEKGEMVAVFGTYKESEYMTKHHERKTSFDTSVQFLWPASAIVDPYNYTKLFSPMNGAPDVMESANDDYDNEQRTPAPPKAFTRPMTEEQFTPAAPQAMPQQDFEELDPDEDLPFNGGLRFP